MSGGSKPRTQVAESFAQRLVRRAGWVIRDRWPNRKVVREVQGVRMTLPWSHRLPDYARIGPLYGQNLVRLAGMLAEDDQPLLMLDVGANVGDSALQVLNSGEGTPDAKVLCVEGDQVFLEFLDINVGSDPRVSIEPSLLMPDNAADVALSPVRVGGTTRFEPGHSTESAPVVTVGELRRRHPDFEKLRLAKSDTDGHDAVLVPAIARTWEDSRPVLFFEYDPRLSRLAGNDVATVWPELEALGYDTVAVWDNGGVPLGRLSITEAARAAATLGQPGGVLYWDVAVAHAEDNRGKRVLEQLVPQNLRA